MRVTIPIAGAITTVMLLGATVAGAGAASPSPSAGELPPGWLVMERFGQAPDGSTTELDYDRRQIWLVRPDGSDLHELAPGAPAGGKSSPEVSPDGTRIAFNTWNEPVQAWDVAPDGSDLRLLSTDCSGVLPDCIEGEPSYSPDGAQVAVVRIETVDDVEWSWITIRDLAAGTRTDLAATRTAATTDGWVSQPSWSPDGTRIAYHRTPNVPAGYPFGVTGWIADLATGTVTQLATPDGEDAVDLRWSPDGSRIAYSTYGARESEGIVVEPVRAVTINPDGTDPVVVCDGTRTDGCLSPVYLPGGEQLMVFGYQTWDVVGADGQGLRPIDAEHLTWFGGEPGQGYGYVAVWLPDQG